MGVIWFENWVRSRILCCVMLKKARVRIFFKIFFGLCDTFGEFPVGNKKKPWKIFEIRSSKISGWVDIIFTIFKKTKFSSLTWKKLRQDSKNILKNCLTIYPRSRCDTSLRDNKIEASCFKQLKNFEQLKKRQVSVENTSITFDDSINWYWRYPATGEEKFTSQWHKLKRKINRTKLFNLKQKKKIKIILILLIQLVHFLVN